MDQHSRRDFDVAVFMTYLYWPTVVGLPIASAMLPTVLVPTAHDEPALHQPLYDTLFHHADRLYFNSQEEAELLETPPRMCSTGRCHRHRHRARSREGSRRPSISHRARRRAVPRLRGPDRRAQGRLDHPPLVHGPQGTAAGAAPAGAGRPQHGRAALAPGRDHDRIRLHRGPQRGHGRGTGPRAAVDQRELLAGPGRSVGLRGARRRVQPLTGPRRPGPPVRWRHPRRRVRGVRSGGRAPGGRAGHARVLADAGRRYVEATYAWDIVLDRVEACLQAAIARHGAG